MNTSTILLTVATGRTGRRLASRLGSNARCSIRLASRNGTPSFSWTAPESWHQHLSGADAAFLCYVPDVADPEAPEILGAFSAAAREHGVRRLVLQSGRGDSAASGNAILEFTGPQSLTFGEAAGILTSRLGRRVVHEPTAPADFVAAAGEYGLSPAEAEGIVWLFAEVMNGSVSNVSPDLERLLGRPAGAMTDYVGRTASAGIWSIPQEPGA